ncbi:nuclear transport factor 2 family protein [Mycolicibacterium vaccae]|uniref:nuclear transport factor 2 family protein n=1 Tax=Mycolicibacterium vaccae TaxID=1810 RepID=UPI003D013014
MKETTVRDDVAVVTAFFEAVAADRQRDCAAMIHEDMRLEEPAGLPYGGVYEGKQGVAELYRRVSRLFEVEIHGFEAHAAGERVAAVVDVTFTCRATGRSIRTSVVELWKVKDQLLVRADIYPKDTRAIYELTL